MHELVISERGLTELHAGDSRAQKRRDLLDAIKRLHREPVKVYRTYVQDPYFEGEREFILITSSKELHLTIGRLVDEAQLDFCCVLEEEHEFAEDNAMLVLLPGKEDGDPGVGILVSRTSDMGTIDGDFITFHLSMAR